MFYKGGNKMMNDKKVVEQMKQLKKEVDELSEAVNIWLQEVEFLGNQCASTDRKLERVVDVGVNKVSKTLKKVSNLYEKQFKY
jgi:chromosome segregation ATPase